MIIGIDVDDVLAHLTDSLRLWHNEAYGTDNQPEDHNDYDLSKVWGCTFEERTRRLGEYFLSDHFKNVMPVPGAVEVVEKLSKEHTLHVITSRHDGLYEVTHNFLNRHFPGKFEEVHMTGQMDPNAVKKTKADVCREIKVELMIEDGLHYAEECSQVGTKVLLMDVPWNQSDNLPEGVVRVKGWGEVLKNIKE